MDDTNSIVFSVVVPVYKGELFLDTLYERLKTTLENITNKFEIILVNDSSPDGSWNIIKRIVDKDPRVIGIDLSRNFGQHYAITAGLDKSRGNWVVVMDCDLQDKPEEIIKLYKKAKEGFDIVLGRRVERKDNFIKRVSSKLFYKTFSYLTDTKQDESVANFGIYSRETINAIISMRENLRFFPIMVKWVGYKSTSIDIEHGARELGRSSYTFRNLLKLSLNTMLSYSDKPLKITVKIGFFISLFSFVYALVIIVRALLGIKGIEGWPSLIVSIWLIGGLLLFVLGIIGLYISRIFDETKKRPIYLVREIYGE